MYVSGKVAMLYYVVRVVSNAANPDNASSRSRLESNRSTKGQDMNLLLSLAHILMGDFVSKFELALLLSEMRVDGIDGLVYNGVRFPGPAHGRGVS